MFVFPRLAAANHQPQEPQAGSLSGVERIDLLLGGGLDRGTSTLLIGPAGSGKSSIALQYAAAAAERGENALVLSFEEGLTKIFKRSQGLVGEPLIDFQRVLSGTPTYIGGPDAARLSNLGACPLCSDRDRPLAGIPKSDRHCTDVLRRQAGDRNLSFPEGRGLDDQDKRQRDRHRP